AMREQPSLVPAVSALRRALEAEDYEAARHACAELEREVGAAELTPRTRRSAERALREVREGVSPEAYWRGATWKRIAVIAAGPLANIVVAFLLLFLVFAISGGPSQQASAQVFAVQSGTPAAAVGLRPGDRIVAVDGRPTPTFDAASHLIRSSRGRPVAVTVLRNGQRVALRPHRTVRLDGHWVFGFQVATELVPYSIGKSASTAGSGIWSV